MQLLLLDSFDAYIDRWMGMIEAATRGNGTQLTVALRFCMKMSSVRDARVAKALIARGIVPHVLTPAVRCVTNDQRKPFAEMAFEVAIALLNMAPVEAMAALEAVEAAPGSTDVEPPWRGSIARSAKKTRQRPPPPFPAPSRSRTWLARQRPPPRRFAVCVGASGTPADGRRLVSLWL